MFDIPTSVTVGDIEYPIRNKGDFRMVLDCFEVLNDTELDKNTQIVTCLIIFYDGMTDEYDVKTTFGSHIDDAVFEMFNFFNCGQPNIGAVSKYKLVDWKQDANLIAGAINVVAKKEIRLEVFLHWWTFMGYYMNIGDSAFSTIIGIRSKIKSGKKLEKHEKEFKRDNPQYFVWDSQSSIDKEADDYVRSLWNEEG